MLKLIKEYELELRSLPYAMADNQVIYVESDYNPRVNEFLKKNYWKVRQLFRRELLEFIYIPAEYNHAMEEGPASKEWLSNRLPMSREFIAQRKPDLTTGEVFNENAAIDAIPPSCICNGFGYSMGYNLYFDAYHLDLNGKDDDSWLMLQFQQIAESYSRKKSQRWEHLYGDYEVQSMLYEVERLQRALRVKGVIPEVFDQITQSLNRELSLVVTSNARLIIPELNGKELVMNPITRTLYLLILSHPEGIHPDAIVGHWNEMLRVYGGLTHFDDKTHIERVVETLCKEDKVSLYSTVSHLRQNLVSDLGPKIAGDYAIIRDKDKLYHITIDRSRVMWEDEKWMMK